MVLVMLSCIVLGMGLPTSAAYMIVAIFGAPALIKLGVPALVAHFFVFYYAIISAIMPPVAGAAYAGATIAETPMPATGWTSPARWPPRSSAWLRWGSRCRASRWSRGTGLNDWRPRPRRLRLSMAAGKAILAAAGRWCWYAQFRSSAGATTGETSHGPTAETRTGANDRGPAARA